MKKQLPAHSRKPAQSHSQSHADKHSLATKPIASEERLASSLKTAEISGPSEVTEDCTEPKHDEETVSRASGPVDHPEETIHHVESKVREAEVTVKEAEVTVKGTPAIDWTKPVYLVTDNNLAAAVRIARPSVRLFRLAQIESAMARGEMEMAKIMLQVLAAPGRCPRMDVRGSSRFASLCRCLGLPMGYAVESIPHTPSISNAPNSPNSPELALPDMHLPKTPSSADDEAETQRLQAEVDEVVRRTPAIQRITPPHRHSAITRAATALRETRVLQRLNSTATLTRSDATWRGEGKDDLSRSGSAYLYALVTPSKKLREMLDSDSAVSPVRRSRRILNRSSHLASANPPHSGTLYEQLTDVPDLAVRGFIPNSAISARSALFKDSVRGKRDPIDLTACRSPSPSTKRAKTPAPENEDTDPSPFL